MVTKEDIHKNIEISGLSACTGKLCIFGHLGLVFIWSCFVSCLLLLLYYVICAPVLTEGTEISLGKISVEKYYHENVLPKRFHLNGNMLGLHP